jgi:hypothetical protein
MGKAPKMTPQHRLVVMIDLFTIKAIEFQNFGKPGADGYNLLEVCCRNDIFFFAVNVNRKF